MYKKLIKEKRNKDRFDSIDCLATDGKTESETKYTEVKDHNIKNIICQEKRLANPQKREEHNLKAKTCQEKRFADPQKREEHKYEL